MKTLFLLFDSLNRQALSCYSGTAVKTPNFDRIAAKGVRFDNHYAGSLPCMPARRDLLTGRLNFLHRSWGPVEPYDVCFPAIMRDAGVHTHLISDHYHYWEEGGAGYHNQYSSFEFVRGQERDLWKAMLKPPVERFREHYHPMLSDTPRRRPNMVNREFIREENDFPVVQCIDRALEFLTLNHDSDNWLLQVELFDPHEPFVAPDRYRKELPTDYTGPVLDWPLYDQLEISQQEADELRANYHAVVAMCDHHLGRLLDEFDRLKLWQDTAIVVTTDHGFLLGEQKWWGKNRMPMYDPIVHIPLLIYHPNFPVSAGSQRQSLTQCLDISSTLLDFFEIPQDQFSEGHTLSPLLSEDCTVRDSALFGIFGGALNITDGRYTYFHYPVANSESEGNQNLFEYTLMPMHPQSYFTLDELREAELYREFNFSRGMPLLRVKARDDAKRPPMQGGALADAKNVLFDVERDGLQNHSIDDPAIRQRMRKRIIERLRKNEAPVELFKRFGLEA